jgi:hypothetical protein
MMNSESGIDRPGVGPSDHVVPEESVRGAGTKTCQASVSSTYR